MLFPGGFIVRLFNPVTLTEVIPGLHDVTGAIELPEDNWFFTMTEIPQGMELTINEKGEPILIEVNQSQGKQAK
jgi:hypothetical protein|nr:MULTISPECIES: hypothetical protein [Escherichia]